MTDADDRELGVLISRYREHRDTLRRLSASAPDTRLAERYEKLVEALSVTIERLGEMQRTERNAPDELSELAMPLIEGTRERSEPSSLPFEDDDELPEDTDERPMDPMESGSWDQPFVRDFGDREDEETGSKLPLILILLVGLPILAGLIWMRATGEPESSERISSESQSEETVVEETRQSLTVRPASHDYGTVRRGTRSSHTFTISNDTEQTINVTVDRSSCRCLWYDVPDGGLEPGESGRLVITVDGSRVTGSLAETVVVRGGSSFSATIDLDAVIR